MAGIPNKGKAARKRRISRPPIGLDSFQINELRSAGKPFDSLAGRPYTPAAQSVVPISTGSPALVA
jgi:hypothetical protein